MYAQIGLNSINVAPSPENYETLDQLVRIIDFAEELTILFARCNVPILRQTLAAEAIRHLAAKDMTVVVVEWAESKGSFLDHLRQKLSPAITSQERLAVFVYGLEQSMPSSDPYPPILAELNSARELFHRNAPYPIVFWLPDYALTALARGALDFWAWRSGVFEFETEPIYRTQALHLYTRQDADWLAINNMTAEQKRRRRHVLQNLLADYEALPQDKQILTEQGEIMFTLGQLNEALGDHKAAHCCYQQSLAISEKLSNRILVANTLHRIGTLYIMEGQYEQAQAQYEQLLAMGQKAGSQSVDAIALHKLGEVYYLQEKKEKAENYYQQSLAIARKIGDHSIEALNLIELGALQFKRKQYTLANTYSQQALRLNEKLGDQIGVATNLTFLGILSQAQGYYEKALAYYEQGKQIFQKLGLRYSLAHSLVFMGSLCQDQGSITEAITMFTEALTLFEELGAPEQETTQAILINLQTQMGQEAFDKASQAALALQNNENHRPVGAMASGR